MEGSGKKEGRENYLYVVTFYLMEINAFFGPFWKMDSVPKQTLIGGLIHRRPIFSLGAML